jgi:hypothetical protein
MILTLSVLDLALYELATRMSDLLAYDARFDRITYAEVCSFWQVLQ